MAREFSLEVWMLTRSLNGLILYSGARQHRLLHLLLNCKFLIIIIIIFIMELTYITFSCIFIMPRP
jgi:hypothetical protein